MQAAAVGDREVADAQLLPVGIADGVMVTLLPSGWRMGPEMTWSSASDGPGPVQTDPTVTRAGTHSLLVPAVEAAERLGVIVGRGRQ